MINLTFAIPLGLVWYYQVSLSEFIINYKFWGSTSIKSWHWLNSTLMINPLTDAGQPSGTGPNGWGPGGRRARGRGADAKPARPVEGGSH